MTKKLNFPLAYNIDDFSNIRLNLSNQIPSLKMLCLQTIEPDTSLLSGKVQERVRCAMGDNYTYTPTLIMNQVRLYVLKEELDIVINRIISDMNFLENIWSRFLDQAQNVKERKRELWGKMIYFISEYYQTIDKYNHFTRIIEKFENLSELWADVRCEIYGICGEMREGITESEHYILNFYIEKHSLEPKTIF